MAGGGTGGHVIPLIAVARVLRGRGHQVIFIGTRRGMEARLVPAAGFEIEWIDIGGVKGMGWRRSLASLAQVPAAVAAVLRIFRRHAPVAVFSLGGYAAAPVVAAAVLKRVPVIVMEPNAMPGAVNRYAGRFVHRALLSFDEARSFFPADRTEITGLPVRQEFFDLPRKRREPVLNLLITGGSQGSRTLNRSAVESWPLFRASGAKVRIVHQTGKDAYEEIAQAFAVSGIEGEIVPFIPDMPSAFAAADVIVCRSGAGAVAEIAAAGKAAVLVPFPFAADQHQLRNAEAMSRAGAARLVLDAEMNGKRLFDEVMAIDIESTGGKAREFARPGAAQRAAELLEALDFRAEARNN